MQLSMLKYAVVALAAHTSGVLSQSTPAQVVANIKSLTNKSKALQAPANDISLISGPLIVVGQGPFPKIILGFSDIVSTATAALPAMQVMPPVPPGTDSDLIFDAFREFVYVHQVLLNILIGKAGLFTVVPLIGAPVAAALRAIEGVVDKAAFTLINNVQSRAGDIQDEAGKLKGSLSTSIEKYQGLTKGSLL
ncbi:hypothetical protein LZ30DRAFT_599452 [Colletotrichum cereale]|nr:hypothetical protein LZ30DRAFT_599452 [Colletotrichum cereale]